MKLWLTVLQLLLRRSLGPALPGVVSVGITVCGMVAMATPLAMWIAWSITVLEVVIVIGMAAVLCMFFLAWLSPNDRV